MSDEQQATARVYGSYHHDPHPARIGGTGVM